MTTDHESYQLAMMEPAEAFDYAIAKGWLSANESAPNYAGNYMYMCGIEYDAKFKHIDTREMLTF